MASDLISAQKNEIVVYQPNETLRLEVRVEQDQVWLNRQQMARLFGRDVKTIGKHIANALKEELSPTVANLAPVADMLQSGGEMDGTLLIDSWVDIVTLELLAKKANGVTVEIVTSFRGNKLKPSDIAMFNTQYSGLSVRISKNFHDRFLIIDDRVVYLIGASLKDLGRKCFAFTKLASGEIPRLKARI